MNLQELKGKEPQELLKQADKLGIENPSSLRKQDLMFAILKTIAEEGEIITGLGVIEIMQDGFGFLRSSESNYLPGPDDIYISPSQIKKFSLRTGDSVEGEIRSPKQGERYFAITKINKINGQETDLVKNRVNFEDLTPLYPEARFKLEQEKPMPDNTERIIDIIAPLGKGQRQLIVAQPFTGKTIIMQKIANAITANSPDAKLIVLPVKGCATISCLCPFPRGAIISIILSVLSGIGFSCSSLNLESGYKGVRSSKFTLFLTKSVSFSLILFILTIAKYLSPFFGALISPSTLSPVLKLNFLI